MKKKEKKTRSLMVKTSRSLVVKTRFKKRIKEKAID